MTDREIFMSEALKLAKQAGAEGEIPVGCVIVKDGVIVGRGRNLREQKKNALLHAEIQAINDACNNLSSWRLSDCTIYVTLEPCPMCAGAILNARIGTVCYGASDTKMGACGGVMNIFEEAFGYRPRVYKGILAEESTAVLKDFFKDLR